eukprot:6199050-Pleurochrysis_carterae.AAC.2
MPYLLARKPEGIVSSNTTLHSGLQFTPRHGATHAYRQRGRLTSNKSETSYSRTARISQRYHRMYRGKMERAKGNCVRWP